MGRHLGKWVASHEGGSYHPGPHPGNLEGKISLPSVRQLHPCWGKAANKNRDIHLNQSPSLLIGLGCEAGDVLGGTRPCVMGLFVKRD